MNQLEQYGFSERDAKEAGNDPGQYPARIIAQFPSLYRIVTECDEGYATLSGKLRFEALDPAQCPAVGDFVMVDRTEMHSGNACIQRVLPRRSLFCRAAAGTAHQAQVVAANIDVVFVCMALNSNYNLSRLERYLAVAWDSGATPVVVLTKADLAEDLPELLKEIESAAPGTEIVTTSAFDEGSCKKLLSYVGPQKTASFIGSSGVGKSTLVNLLLGDAALRTGDVRTDGKGRHTTTNRELVLLPSGGIVIDTPGMRELGIESADLCASFPDIEALEQQCRFRDCTHTSEPGCAIRQALEEGRLDSRRFENYQKLNREARYDGLTAKKRESEKLNGMFQSVGGMKKVRRYIRETDKRSGG